jgi:hypothetical protein
MDRIRQIWIESARSSSFEGPHHQHHCNSRPPPLRTSSTYDDDDTFNNVALNLMSRYESLGLTAMEAILATLIGAKQRASFYDGLCIRLDRSSHMSPNTASLLESLERVFGHHLKEMVMAECKGQPCYSTKPATPRHTAGIVGGGGAPATCRNAKKTTPRRFFPDGDKISAPSMGFFGSKRRVQNIDWKLAEAIQQVEHLRLDGVASPPNSTPPTTSTGYEPPRGF